MSRKVKVFLIRCISIVLIMQLLFHSTVFDQQVKAQETTQNVTNMVVFVRYANDSRDIFNAQKEVSGDVRKNWDALLDMYNGDGSIPDNSFKTYISTITEGKINVNNYMPQQLPDGSGVATYTLSQSAYSSDTAIIMEVINAMSTDAGAAGKIHIDSSANKLDNLYGGYLDNLTIIVQGDGNTDDLIYPHKSIYGGDEKIAGVYVSSYNIIDSDSLVGEDGDPYHGGQKQGVISHEFLHTLGLPDLYRYDSDGDPVGAWDIMAQTSPFLQYPLSYLRAQQGWVNKGQITESGTYTLTAADVTGGTKVFEIMTPLSDTEKN